MINVKKTSRVLHEIEAKGATAYDIYVCMLKNIPETARLIDVDERDGIFILVFESETYE